MALLPILEYPDPRLRIRAEPVTKFDAEVQQLVADMLETMYAAPGIGLAATQVNVHKRIVVCDVAGEPCSGDVKAAVKADLEAKREVNFLFFVLDPTYTTIHVKWAVVPLPG